MNFQLVNELAKQAGVDAGQLLAEILCADGDSNIRIADAWNSQPIELREQIFNTIEKNQQKFAELIIREYLNIQ